MIKDFWSKETDDAVIAFQDASSSSEKNKIYVDHLHIPFVEMVEYACKKCEYKTKNIIN